jgi:glycosyltransferase involved in cell wall biosynthesis
VELITKGEQSLEAVLVSLARQKFRDYEIVCVNSSKYQETSQLLHKFGVKEIIVDPETRHLEARYLAHLNSSGQYMLLLDSTRPLEENTMELLINKYSNFPAVVIKEGSIGHGFWVNQADKLRSLSEILFSDFLDKNVAYILPRFFHAEVLDKAFNSLKEKIDDKLFKEIGYGEHHLIYEAAKLRRNEIVITDEILLRHFEDSSAKSIFRKYMWYGKSQKTLNKLELDTNAKSFRSHLRPYSSSMIIPSMKTIPIRSLRVFAFLLGYLILQ